MLVASGEEESLEEANVRLGLVNRIASAMGSSLGMDGVVDLAVRSLGDAFPDLRVSYSTVDAAGRTTVLRSIDPEGMPQHEATTWELADATEYLAAIRRQEIVVAEDVKRDPRMAHLGEIMAASGVRALVTAGLPEALGATGLLSFNAPRVRRWSEHEVATLTEAAAYLFLAIQQASHELQRAESEEALRRRAELETLLGNLSTDFINMPASEIDAAIGRVLPDLARAADAEAVLVFLFSEDRSELVNTFEWLSPEVGMGKVRPAALATWELPGLMKTLARLEPFCVPNPRMLAPEERAEREHFERYGLRSLLGIPISTRGDLLGFVGLVHLLSDRGWRDEAVAVLRVVGDIFGGALDRKHSEESLAAARRQLEAGNRELEQSNRAMTLLNELGDLLQSCNRVEEAGEVVDDLLPKLYPGLAGAVYLFAPASSLLEAAASWGDPPPSEGPFGTEDCWALRRGRFHRLEGDGPGPACPHVGVDLDRGSICLPLMAQGQALGLLHLRTAPGGKLRDDILPLALSTAEHLALGVANLLLRERLRSQALRDPLTGLVNRPYLEEQIVREVRRARRHETPLSLAVLGMDALEAIAGVHGPEAGDLLLAQVAKLLLETLPPEGLAARLDDRVLAVLLPEQGLDEARRAAGIWRERVHGLELLYGAHRIAAGSLSIGLAVFPSSALDGAGLEAAAAAALATAHAEGGDTLVEAGEPLRPSRVLRTASPPRTH